MTVTAPPHEETPIFAFSGARFLLCPGGRLPRWDDLATLGVTGPPTAVRFSPGETHAQRSDASREAPGPGGTPDGSARALAVDLGDDFEPPAGFELLALRQAYGRVPYAEFRLAGAAFQKLDWLRSYRFCPRCGHRTRRHARHEAMECTVCGRLHFARVEPAVIVLVERAGRILLARSPRFKDGFYSTLAGFVEPGETLEECVHREIMEEVGLRVGRLRYFGSQPWPFPCSLMVGFTARYEGGEIRPDPAEIDDARWFAPDDLPPLPPKMSIARALIDDFLARTAASGGDPVR